MIKVASTTQKLWTCSATFFRIDRKHNLFIHTHTLMLLVSNWYGISSLTRIWKLTASPHHTRVLQYPHQIQLSSIKALSLSLLLDHAWLVEKSWEVHNMLNNWKANNVSSTNHITSCFNRTSHSAMTRQGKYALDSLITSLLSCMYKDS